MNCPKCSGEFERVVFNTIEVERCQECRGLWFDMLEKDDLIKMEGSEVIDIGSPERGRLHDTQRQIRCPVCAVGMISMVDMTLTHIHYESCPTCYGTFFDAGEFSHLKEITVLERFTAMLETLRANL